MATAVCGRRLARFLPSNFKKELKGVNEKSCTMGAEMVTNWRFLFSPGIAARHNRVSAKDPLNSCKATLMISWAQMMDEKTMIKTARSAPDSLFCCRSTMEFAHDILLDQKVLYRSVHATFVNTEWHEAWLERTLFLESRVRACSRGCQASLVTVITQDILVMTHLLFRLCVVVLSFVTSRWVTEAAAGSARSDAFFHSFLARPVATTRRIFCWSQRSSLIWLCLAFCL